MKIDEKKEVNPEPLYTDSKIRDITRKTKNRKRKKKGK